MHVDYWSKSLPRPQFIGMTTMLHTGMLKNYNLRQLLTKSRATCGRYRNCCVDNGLYSLANSQLYKNNGDNDNDDECEIDVRQPVSKRTLKRREKSMLKLALTHNAAVGVTQNLLNQFTSQLLHKNVSVKQHIQKQMTPIIVRDLNQQIKNHRLNEQRQMKEALILRNKHISTRKHLGTRKGQSMVKPIKYDLNGYPYRGKAVVGKLESGLKINTGNTRAMNNESYDKFMNMVYNIVRWQHPNENTKPIIWRSILLIMIIFMRCTIDGVLTEKWNEYYHWTCIVEEEIQTCDENTNEDFMQQYQLSIGDSYWTNPHPLMVVLTGDGSDIPKTNSDTGSFGLAKFHIFTHEHLQQTLMIAVLFMFAGLSHYDQIVIDCYQKCSKKLGKDGGFAVASDKAKCKMLVNWYRYDNGDWPWVATIVQRSFHHSGNYPFIYWVKYIGKTFISVKKTHDKLLKAIKAGIKDEHMPWNLKIDDIKDTDNFYTLAQEEHFKHWQEELENFMKNLKNVDQLTKEQKHVKRRNYANEHGIPLLYETSVVLVQYCLDLTHAILRIVSFWICVLVILLFCVYVRSIAEVCTVLGHLCLPDVVDKFENWMKTNKKRNANKKLKFNITGNMSCIALKSFPYCVSQAAWLIQDYELTQIRKYIESHVHPSQNVENITVEIDYIYDNGDNLNDSNDSHDLNIDDGNNVSNDLNVPLFFNIDDSNDSNDSNIDDNNNVSNNLNDLNDSNVPLFFNIDDSNDSNNSNNVSNDSDVSVIVNADNVSNDSNDSHVSVPRFDDEDSKQHVLDDDDVDVMTRGNEAVNAASEFMVNDSGKNDGNNNKLGEIIGIDYRYKYTLHNDNHVYTFDNNKNVAKVKYSRTMTLALLWDYIRSYRQVFGVLSTLRWSKNVGQKTPTKIKKSQLIGRSAIYKGEIFADWLLHEYAWFIGGIAPYMQEAFWYYNPHGYGVFVVCQQMCENFAAWMKEDRRECGSANGNDYLMQVARNSDLNVLARFYYDQVDLKELSHNEKLRHVSIFDDEHNYQVENQLLKESPILFDKFACVFKSIQVNDTIPKFLQNVSGDSIEDDDEYDRLRRGLKKYSENVSDDSDDSDDDNNEQKRNENVASRWRRRVENINQVVKNVEKAQMNKVKKKPKKQQKFQKKSWNAK